MTKYWNQLIGKPRLLVYLPVLAGIVFMLMMLLRYGVNVPYWDDWEVVSLLQKHDAGNLVIGDFWQQHNEHRMFFPKLLIFTLAQLTNWHLGAQMMVSLLFATISITILYLTVLRTISKTSLAFAAMSLISVWFFSPVQWQNWLWGWQVQSFMGIAVLLAIIFILCLVPNRDKGLRSINLWLLILLAVVVSYSPGGGLLIWPIGLVVFVYKQRGKTHIIAWSLSAMATIGLYFYNYMSVDDFHSKEIAIEQPLYFLSYYFNFLGRPISERPSTSILWGAIILGSLIPLIILVKKNKSHMAKFAPWLILIFFSLTSGFLTALTRVGLGVEQGGSSRYTAVSILLFIGVIGLVFTLLDISKFNFNNNIPIALIGVAFLGPLFFSSYTSGINEFRKNSEHMRRIKTCSVIENPSHDCLTSLYPHYWIVKPRLEYLKSKNMAGY